MLDLVDILLPLAAGLSLFLTVLILLRYGKHPSNRFLAALLFCYSLILIFLLLGEMGLTGYHPRIMLACLGLAFLIPSLHFLYTKTLVNPD